MLKNYVFLGSETMWSKGELFGLSGMILVKWGQGEGKGSLQSREGYLE